jgi:hypothetical protein
MPLEPPRCKRRAIDFDHFDQRKRMYADIFGRKNASLRWRYPSERVSKCYSLLTYYLIPNTRVVGFKWTAKLDRVLTRFRAAGKYAPGSLKYTVF